MLKGLPILCTILLLLPLASPAAATSFVDSLQKRFKKLDYPHDDVTVRITLQTHMTDNTGNQTDESVLLVYRTHAKVVSVFRNNGWTGDDPLRIDGIDVGVIDLIPELSGHGNHKGNLRLQAFVYACDPPDFKYRGGSLEAFFQKQLLEKAEQCFTYDEQLQGKNYPYQ